MSKSLGKVPVKASGAACGAWSSVKSGARTAVIDAKNTVMEYKYRVRLKDSAPIHPILLTLRNLGFLVIEYDPNTLYMIANGEMFLGDDNVLRTRKECEGRAADLKGIISLYPCSETEFDAAISAKLVELDKLNRFDPANGDA